MTNTPMNKEQLLHWVNQASFALTDIVLFLDTHPCDEEAINYYNHYQALRRKAVRQYEEQYGPLTTDYTPAGGHWCWATQSWPWEGGCK